jgi:hypothetical protein
MTSDLPGVGGIVWYALTASLGGFVILFWRIVKGSTEDIKNLRQDIQNLRNELVSAGSSLATMPLIYRTKEEATKDWKELLQTLAGIKADLMNLQKNQDAGIRQLWDKLNRSFESYMFMAKTVIDRQQSLESKIYCHDQEQLQKAMKETAELNAQLDRMSAERDHQ